MKVSKFIMGVLLLCNVYTTTLLGSEVGVVMSPNISVYNTVTKRKVRELFSGTTILHPFTLEVTRLVLLPTNSEDHLVFCKDVLDINPSLYSMKVDRLVEAGLIQRPYVATDVIDLVLFIYKHKNSVGYSSKDNILVYNMSGKVQFIRVEK